MMGIQELIVSLGFFCVFLVGGILWVWMIVECATREPEGTNKIVWILVVTLAGCIGAAIYFFARRPQRIAETGR